MNIDWDSISGLVKVARLSKIPKLSVLGRLREITAGTEVNLVETEARLRAIIEAVYKIPEREMEAIKIWFLREGERLRAEGDDVMAEALLKNLGKNEAN